jgi:hypothetical protein
VGALVNDGSALVVAGAAIGHALRRRCGVVFLQVVCPTLDRQGQDEAVAATFGAAMTALSGHRLPHCTFVTTGNVDVTSHAHSRGASVLVLGAEAPFATQAAAQYRHRNAGCPVYLVPAVPQPGDVAPAVP